MPTKTSALNDRKCWYCGEEAVWYLTFSDCGFSVCSFVGHWKPDNFKAWMKANEGRTEVHGNERTKWLTA